MSTPERSPRMERSVSVVVCCYNMATELRGCLESLSRQVYGKKELIVVDDASTDDTRKVAAEYQGRIGDRLNVVVNPVNSGVAASRNAGIRHAKGDLIAFTDADCAADPNWLSELVESFCREGPAAVGGRIEDAGFSNVWERSEKGHNYVAPAEGCVTYVQGCNMAFDAQILRSFMFSEELKYGYEEALLCDELVRAGHRIWYNPRAVVYHKHRSSLVGLLRQKYKRGYSSIWYRKRQGKFFMLKRHFLMLTSMLMAPGCAISALFGYLIAGLLSLVILSLVRDEYLYGAKRAAEIWSTLPVLCATELAHFGGAFVGLFVFRVCKPFKAA
jgi:glycosyltransferase involved in cell wall biosynthesis